MREPTEAERLYEGLRWLEIGDDDPADLVPGWVEWQRDEDDGDDPDAEPDDHLDPVPKPENPRDPGYGRRLAGRLDKDE